MTECETHTAPPGKGGAVCVDPFQAPPHYQQHLKKQQPLRFAGAAHGAAGLTATLTVVTTGTTSQYFSSRTTFSGTNSQTLRVALTTTGLHSVT